MTSKIAVANRALTKLGDERITSLEDDQKAAREVNSMFDIVRDDELRARAWSFSIARAELPALTEAPLFGYTKQYQLPTQCLRLIELAGWWVGPSMADYRNSPDREFVIEGRKLLCSIAAPLRIRYIQQIDDTGLWDANFVEAFACRLAAELADPLTQSTTRKAEMWQEYDRAIAKGRRANAIELPPDEIQDDTWVIGRRRG